MVVFAYEALRPSQYHKMKRWVMCVSGIFSDHIMIEDKKELWETNVKKNTVMSILLLLNPEDHECLTLTVK